MEEEMMKTILVGTLAVLILFGCADIRQFAPTSTTYQLDSTGRRVSETIVEDGLIAAAREQFKAQQECYRAQAEKPRSFPIVDLTKMTPTMQFAYTLSENNRQLTEVVVRALGTKDPCALIGDNIFSMTARESEATMAYNSKAIGLLSMPLNIATGGWAAGYFAGKIKGNTYNVGGDGNEINRSTSQIQTAGQTTRENYVEQGAGGSSGGYDPSLGCSYETWFSNGGFCPS
jgi:hypothetical protein